MTLDQLIRGSDKVGSKFGWSLAGVISKGLEYAYVFAGVALLVMLVMGGVGLMTAAGNPDKAKESYGKITGALIGFLIVFTSYFLVQIIEVVLGVEIL